ncbi:RING finger protein 112 isoform X2 [Prionailurus viverrinus]|uniref:RING finger protein 112 isoform X2 n=1 Tax=Prionailurus viverrinus TaxID=61388 RepID=UPI001FF3742B|nr:RING finger protein 112 isoform X2 [Prionailurus viverrinus]
MSGRGAEFGVGHAPRLGPGSHCLGAQGTLSPLPLGPGDLLREGRAAAAGAHQCLRRPHPEDGGHQPLPEAPPGQGHPCLPPRCPGGAALREDLPPQPPAPGPAGPGGCVPGGHRGRHEPGAEQGNQDQALCPHHDAELLPDPQHLPGAEGYRPGISGDVCARGRGDGQALWDGADPGKTPMSRHVTPDSNTPQLLVSGPLLFQHLDLLVRDSSHPNKAGLGRVGDVIQKASSKYPKVQELLRGRRARCYLLPAPERRWASKDHGSPGDTDDDVRHLCAYVADVLSAVPQHAKSRCQGYWSEGRPAARGDRRLLTGQQLAQEIKNLSGWMGRTGPGFTSPDEMAAQLHDLRTVEAAKKEFEEYVRQQDVATKRIFSALRVLPDTMRTLLATQKDAILARHGAALLCKGREQTLEALEAELQAEAKVFMDSYTMRFCGHLAAVGGAVGAGLMGLAGGVVGAGMAAAALAAEAGMVAAGAAVGATGAAVVGGGVGAGLAATVGCMEKEDDERVQEGDREPLLQEE